MRIVKRVLLSLLVLMSLAAGIPKILGMPQELEFLAHLGLGPNAVMLLGICQFAAGILLVPPKSRLVGAVLAVIALAISALALVKGDNLFFGLVTFLPIAIGVFFMVESLSQGRKSRERGTA